MCVSPASQRWTETLDAANDRLTVTASATRSASVAGAAKFASDRPFLPVSGIDLGIGAHRRATDRIGIVDARFPFHMLDTPIKWFRH